MSVYSSKRVSPHGSANDIENRHKYAVYVALGLLSFKDFLRKDDPPKTSTEARADITDALNRRPMVLDTVTGRSCTALTKSITTMWTNAKAHYLHPSSDPHTMPQVGTFKWIKKGTPDFRYISNKQL